jgi:UDP-N-acetyl-2-amino-2-deoxyglucuronate dehydrogenase
VEYEGAEDEMSGVLRIGVIGVGGMGQGHCRTMARVEELSLCAVCDTDAATAEAVATAHGVPGFTAYRELLRAGLCEAVLIATPHPQRPSIARACLAAGLHVLSEKPLSERIGSAEAMVQAAERAGLVLAVDFQRRTEPAIAAAIRLVRQGALGRLYRRTLISPEFRSQAYYDSGGWRATWRGEGGGVMMNQAPHVLDIFVSLGGMPSRVLGRVETRMHRIEVEDHAEALLEYPDGGTGYFMCSTCEAGPGQMIELFGDRGKLCWRNGVLELQRFETPIAEFNARNKKMWGSPACETESVPVVAPPGYEAGHIDILRNFARSVLYGEPLIAPGADGLLSLELANAVWLSAARGGWLELPVSRRAYDRFLAARRRHAAGTQTESVSQRETDPRLGA